MVPLFQSREPATIGEQGKTDDVNGTTAPRNRASKAIRPVLTFCCRDGDGYDVRQLAGSFATAGRC